MEGKVHGDSFVEAGGQQPREMDEVARALRLAEEERQLLEGAGIGTGLLVSGQRRVWLDEHLRRSSSPQGLSARAGCRGGERDRGGHPGGEPA